MRDLTVYISKEMIDGAEDGKPVAKSFGKVVCINFGRRHSTPGPSG
jgi:hypothetical protein